MPRLRNASVLPIS